MLQVLSPQASRQRFSTVVGVLAIAPFLALASFSTRAAGPADVLDRLNLQANTVETCISFEGVESDEPFSAVSKCVANRALTGLLGKSLRLAEEQGQALFGRNFHIENRLSLSATGGGPRGDLDAVFPLHAFFAASGEEAERTLFLQSGVTRWTDDRGFRRNDMRYGLVHRLPVSTRPDAGILGVSAFLQESIERGHQRVVTGLDYAGRWGTGSLSYYLPATDWQLGRPGFEERALEGMELNLRIDATDTVALNAAAGRWESDDGTDDWTTRAKLGFVWHPHPWLGLGSDWDGIGTGDGTLGVRAVVAIPFGGPKQSRPRWKGLGLAGGGAAPSVSDVWRAVDNVGQIEFVEREVRGDPGAGAGVQVRFLQTSAQSGSEFTLEVTSLRPVSGTTTVTVRLVPGSGDNPAEPGVDYSDAPIEVVIPSGATSGTATVRLLSNPDLSAPRSLSARVLLVA